VVSCWLLVVGCSSFLPISPSPPLLKQAIYPVFSLLMRVGNPLQSKQLQTEGVYFIDCSSGFGTPGEKYPIEPE
ncbi:MAG TPA: hypothetical protein DEG47_28070, partial [Cyanobacteria bacterium UBA11148]|nr:hypothetical protein [Cyanobacteria bacterium UBA11148]